LFAVNNIILPIINCSFYGAADLYTMHQLVAKSMTLYNVSCVFIR